MISHAEVVRSHRFIEEKSNQRALLVMGANLETRRQKTDPARPHIITGQQVGAMLELHQVTVAKGKKPPNLDRLMKEVGLQPRSQGWIDTATNWLLTKDPDMTGNIPGAIRLGLPSMGDSGITDRALKRVSFGLMPDISMQELVPWLMDNFTLILHPPHEISVFQSVSTPGAESCFAINPFAYTHGINTAWQILNAS